MFDDSDKVSADVVLLHGCPQSCMPCHLYHVKKNKQTKGLNCAQQTRDTTTDTSITYGNSTWHASKEGFLVILIHLCDMAMNHNSSLISSLVNLHHLCDMAINHNSSLISSLVILLHLCDMAINHNSSLITSLVILLHLCNMAMNHNSSLKTSLVILLHLCDMSMNHNSLISDNLTGYLTSFL